MSEIQISINNLIQEHKNCVYNTYTNSQYSYNYCFVLKEDGIYSKEFTNELGMLFDYWFLEIKGVLYGQNY